MSKKKKKEYNISRHQSINHHRQDHQVLSIPNIWIWLHEFYPSKFLCKDISLVMSKSIKLLFIHWLSILWSSSTPHTYFTTSLPRKRTVGSTFQHLSSSPTVALVDIWSHCWLLANLHLKSSSWTPTQWISTDYLIEKKIYAITSWTP